ncbi:TPA: hypothetical protein ACF91A_002538, partial [Legionella pneumophila]
QRIKKISIANAQGKAKELLEGTKKAMGTELNLFSTFANSPAALEAYKRVLYLTPQTCAILVLMRLDFLSPRPALRRAEKSQGWVFSVFSSLAHSRARSVP